MITNHRVEYRSAADLKAISTRPVDLVVTSPPYPMIRMWDRAFAEQAPETTHHLDNGEGQAAFECMHRVLDGVWGQLADVVKPGGIVCINVGDAVRSVAGEFSLYSNQARIARQMLKNGFTPLPLILWRKPTNAPNKFMGSGMMPPGAYVTLEHEYILIFRNGSRRRFRAGEAMRNRRESAYFWEERNAWFSDVWMDLRGTRQHAPGVSARDRSGSFPFELPYRLIHMFSVRGDLVLDPFLGFGTTMQAAMAAGRDSIGVEMDRRLERAVDENLAAAAGIAEERITRRLDDHRRFAAEHANAGGTMQYTNRHYGFPVKTRQEQELYLDTPMHVRRQQNGGYQVAYAPRRPVSG